MLTPEDRFKKAYDLIHKGVDSSLTTRDRKETIGKEVWGPLGRMYRIYCVSCGTPGGLVTKGALEVHFLCDDCCKQHGGLPLPQVPQEELQNILFEE